MPSTISAGTTAGTAIAVAGDTTGNLAFQTNGTTTAMTITTAQNVGIGIAGPSAKLHTFQSGNQDSTVQFEAGTAGYASNLQLIANNAGGGAYNNITSIAGGSGQWQIGGGGNNNTIVFTTGSGYTQRMRLNENGALLINRTSQLNSERLAITGNVGSQCMALISPITGAYDMCNINNGNGQVGLIQTNGSGTSYVTTSDYRLKENVAPMTGALAKVALLKPCTYTWKVDGSEGQGFIAHELQAVVPDAVSGEKDAVETYTDEDGNEQTRIKPQGVDTSFLVATLTAAIQELKAELDATKAEVAALKGA